ncbi:carnitine/acyl carnitine carrier [Fomitiporia mediterranea MF3/22]|uniref:carnitine/acyl carnitine carrier n=1 Tax=Fomitiporia mediterranea (strain MF3/22) TaxID=694068 RepID=UPI0004407F11|nr:carnitine/acyl carnitine carrier [Fomitiporia mediterranea MF3/22]EJD00003.1 carnitine/acyl carnitine carrier [Fomitiporia mediterranea MF3/22]
MDDSTVKSKKELDPTVDFIAGTVAGVAGLTIAYPFDTVKVRLQSPGISSKYRSTFHAFSTIVREEHFKGLYKGIASPMISCAPLNGLVFASYRFFMRLQLAHADDVPTITQIGFAGIGSGITASLITCPIELIKIRQQNIVDRQSSTRMVAADLFRRTGVRGLYRGLVPTALRDVGYGAYFATYEATCRYFSSRGPPKLEDSHLTDHLSLLAEVENEMDSLSWPVLLFAGALAGVNGWLVTFAFDVVKTRVQSVDRFTSPSSHPYRNTVSTIINSYRSEGLGVFFRGLSPTLLRAIPVNMATFGVFETVVHLLS